MYWTGYCREPKALAGPHLVLCRLDSGHDAAENLFCLHDEALDFLIKWNLSSNSPQDWLKHTEDRADVCWATPGEGKCIGNRL